MVHSTTHAYYGLSHAIDFRKMAVSISGSSLSALLFEHNCSLGDQVIIMPL